LQGYASREAAFDILLEQETSGAFLKDLFPAHAQALPAQDRALVRRLSLGVIRNRSLLDHNIDLYVAKKPGPGKLRTLLRLCAYALFFTDAPAFATVNLGVELAKRRVGRGQSGFVNAVLKKLSAAGLRKAPGDSLQALSINHSHPLWLVKRWHARLGREGLLRALERNNQEAPLWIRANPFRGGAEALARELSEAGVGTQPEGYAPLFLRVTEGADKALHARAFAEGKFAFQDPAAWLVAELADWKPGAEALDLCSAPGGKAACLTERARLRGEDAARIVCNDISFRRLRKIRDAVDRLGHRNLAPVVMDPSRPALRKAFGLVVVDAPCSNLGVIRRRPEARWSHRPEDLARLSLLQQSLLGSAAALCEPGGSILYATCSPEEEETEQVVEAFLKGHSGWILEDAAASLPAWAVKRGFLWLHPGETEYDGFFAARLRAPDDGRRKAA
jgi:16S rRNA (cytosine967-C5)-methyltransferase